MTTGYRLSYREMANAYELVMQTMRDSGDAPAEMPKIQSIESIALRVGRAAIKGGASIFDVLLVLHMLSRNSPTARQVELLMPKAQSKLRQEAAFDRLNAGRLVTDAERERVRSLDAELRATEPLKSRRYEAIDERTGSRRGRARYIMEGPRKTKPGNRGKRKRKF